MKDMSDEERFESDPLFDPVMFEADFEMAVDMFCFAAKENGKDLPNTDEDNVLERFRKSGIPSARRLRM